MKKISYFFSFLNKKGVFALGILVGILLSLFMVFSVSAETTDTSGYVEVFRANTGDGAEWIVYMSETDIDFSKMCWVANNGSTANLYWYCPSKPSVPVKWKYSSEDYFHDDKYDHLALTSYTYKSTCFYIFNTTQEADAYLNGDSDGSNALNYDEVHNSLLEKNKQHDSTIPVPTKAYISTISTSTVSTTFEYDETELNNFKNSTGYDLQYEYEVEYFYQMLSKAQINNQNSSINVEEVNKSDELQYALNDFNIFKSHGTCKEIYEAASVSNDHHFLQMLGTADSGTYKSSGVINLSNAVTSSPPNYYEQYSIPFSLFSMEYHMQFIIAQARITSFYVDDAGVKHCSDDVYIRRSLWDKDNEHYGSTFTRITQDDNGNETFQSSYEMDSKGENISVSGELDNNSIENYIRNGFGLLGHDGYIELSRRFFGGVPTTIWVLIFMAMSVNIAVLLFKIVRGF